MRFSSLAAGLAAAVAAVPAVAQEQVTTQTVEADFASVTADLGDAIVNRGYVVDYHGFIGDMLKRTAADVGGQKALYREAEFFQFCSAVVSRKAMEADIGNIAYCPYVVFAYEAEDAPGKVVVGFRRLPDGDGRDEVNALLKEITREATGDL